MAFQKKPQSALLVAGGLGAALLASRLSRQRPTGYIRGQVVLITGGSRGLGLLLAREFAHEGCKVAICARDPRELERAVDDLKRRGADVFSCVCDVSAQADVDRAVKQVTHHFRRIDILVNNAGIISVGPMQSMSQKDYADAMGVIFWGTFFATQAVLPQMIRRKSGRIVNITSIGGKVSVPHLLPYCCAKFATVALSQGMHSELSKDGVNVTTVVPGLMRTGSHLNAFFKGYAKQEYALFALSALLPPVSIDASRAAREIVDATKRREVEIVLGTPAVLMEKFQTMFPGLFAEIMSWVSQVMLPGVPEGRRVAERGTMVQSHFGPMVQSLFNLLSSLARPHDRNELA